MSQLIYKEQYQHLTSACLNLTDACNLRCIYCFVEQHPHFMSLDVAKASMDWLVKNLRWKQEHGLALSNSKAYITFFGGEPTLLFDEVIIPLVEYGNKTYPNLINYSITTNGTLLNEERIKFMYDNGIFPLLSIDGAKETQDYNRPCHDNSSSFDKVIKNIPFLLKYFPDITFRSTLSEDKVDDLFKNYLFAEYLGFNNYYVTPNCRNDWSEENLKKLEEQFKKIAIYRINQFKNNILPINFSNYDSAFENVLNSDINTLNNVYDRRAVSRNVERCGLGTVGCSIGYDGSIYGCQEQPSKDDKNIFLIGNIFEEGINKKKHLQLLNLYNYLHPAKCAIEDKCKTCQLLSICNTFACPSSSWDLYKDLTTVSPTHCAWLNILFNNARITMNVLVQEQNELFKNYLNNLPQFEQAFKEGE